VQTSLTAHGEREVCLHWGNDMGKTCALFRLVCDTMAGRVRRANPEALEGGRAGCLKLQLR